MTVYAYKVNGEKFHRYDFRLNRQRYTKRGFSTRRRALDSGGGAAAGSAARPFRPLPDVLASRGGFPRGQSAKKE